MGFKNLAIVLVLMFSISIAAGCAGGSGSSTAGANGAEAADTGGTGIAGLAWDAPTTNDDGSPLTDLAGFKVYYGTAPGTYTRTTDVGLATSYSVTGLAPGTYYIVVTAYTSAGSESIYSNEVSKTVL